MATITLQGNEIHTIGDLPPVGADLGNYDFKLTKNDLSDCDLSDFDGKKVVLNIFPSLDTPVCASSVRRFNKEAGKLENTVVLCISRDLPFAQSRFCGAEGLENVITLSEMRDNKFSTNVCVRIIDGPMQSLMARAVIVINENQEIIYTELVPEIVQEPDYNKALESLK